MLFINCEINLVLTCLSNYVVQNDIRTCENIQKIATGQGDDCTTGSLMDHPYFTEKDKLIVIYVRKKQALDEDPKALQQTNFTGNL